jgi:hypothetical protein
MTTIVCYVSGHGFGHASRVAEVLNVLRARRPNVRLVVRGPTPRWFFEFNIHGDFSHASCQLDVGAIQRDSLSVDPEATLRAYADLVARRDTLVQAELTAVAPLRPTLVLADIPPLAFDVAARLDVPAIAMANFSWDWIYADYVADYPDYAPLVDGIRASYGRATLLLRLPLHGDLSAFPRRRDIPFVARAATLARRDVRRRLGLPADRPLILLSFGGIGVELHTPPSAPPDVAFVTNRTPGGPPVPPWCQAISTEAMIESSVRYEDLVAAVDGLITKPGYGIVAECIANATPMIYTPRGRFAEYECLVAGIEAHLRQAVISNEDLHAGRWQEALEAVLDRPRITPAVDIRGAAVAADAICEILDDQ